MIYLSRKAMGFYFLLFSVISLILGITNTVKYASIIDYHEITTENTKTGLIVEGSIDEWYGPVAYSTDGADIYLLALSDDKLIPFSTHSEKHKAIFYAYDENSTDNEEVEFTGELMKMPPDEKDLLLEILVDEGFTTEEAESALIPYYVENTANMVIFFYIGFVVFALVGFAFFLPEFSVLMSRNGVKQKEFEANNQTTNSYNGYQSTYTGTTNANNTYTGSQSYGQNTYGQQTSQAQNGAYTSGQYPPQGQNRTYTGNQYTTQGQNRDYTSDQTNDKSQS